MSLASAEAAEARRKTASTVGYYNLKAGPTAWRFDAGLLAQYEDNVNLTAGSKEDDFRFRPQIDAQMLWPVTEKNSLNLSVGAGYSVYVQHSDLNRIFVSPGSGLSFDLYTGDFWINLHDRLSITEAAYQDPTVSGSGDYARLENAVGATALWDLNKVILRTGYDHVDYLALSTHGDLPDGQSELFSASGSYAITPAVSAGLEVGGGLLRYYGTNTAFTHAHQWSVGSFFETQVSEYVHFRASMGYSVYTPEASGTTIAGNEFSGVYAQVALTHQLNQYLRYTLSGGRSLNFSFFGGSVDLYYARLNANWNVLQKVSLGTSFDFEHGSQVSSGSETFDRYGVGLSLGRAITSKLSGSLAYHYYWRNSDQLGRNYTVNIVSLNLSYAF